MILTENKIETIGYENGKRGVEATYRLKNKTLEMCVQPTNCAYDWIDNFILTNKKFKVRDIEITSKRSWYYYALRLYKFIEREILPYNNIETIDIMGYSMGGAVAQIMYYIIPQEQLNVFITVVTWGSPRAFNKEVYQLINFANKGDIVTCVPPWWKCTYQVRGKFTFNFIKAHTSYNKIGWF